MMKRERVMTEKTFVKSFLYVWPYVLVVAALIYLVGFLLDNEDAWTWTLSFFLGSAVSVMLMSHHYRTSMKTAETSPEDLKKVSIRNYIFRYAFYALILFIAYLSDGLNLIFTFVGFTSFKAALFLTFLVSKEEVSKDAPASSARNDDAEDDTDDQEGEEERNDRVL